MAKCPVCGEKLSEEMVPFGSERPGGKRKFKASAVFPQVLYWAIDAGLRAHVASGRSLYLTCNNAACPACWKATRPVYFKKGIFGPSLMGDSTGVMLTLYQSRYRKRRRRFFD